MSDKTAKTPKTAGPGHGSSGAAIRHAATLVVARPTTADDYEIYMLRRSARSAFMPSTLVFPGGALEDDDGAPDVDVSWERCARRETEEEARLCVPGPLMWFDTWLTPSAESRRRYLARFFLGTLPAGAGQEAAADGLETHAGRWASPAEHLQAWDAGEIDLPPPTLCTLMRLRDLSFARLHTLGELDPGGVILPKVTLVAGGPSIVMPHAPDYPDLPGEGAPAPARAHALPRRFLRDQRGWRPCETASEH